MTTIRAGLMLAIMIGACGSAPPDAQDAPLPGDIPAAYQAALALSPTPRLVQDIHDDWITDGSDPEADYVLDRLQSVIHTARRAETVQVSESDLTDDCIDLYLDQGCGVAAGGFVNTGVEDSPRLYWQLQEGASGEDGVGMGVVFLQLERNGLLKPLLWGFEAARYEAPKVFHPGGGLTLLVARGTSRGSAAAVADLVFVWRDGAWRNVDVHGWDSRDPRFGGLETFLRTPINYDDMFAVADLWKPDDGHCCPTGGRIRLQFDVRDDRLAIADVTRIGGG